MKGINHRHSPDTKQLGMNFGTATHRLWKEIFFQLVQEAERDYCFRCKEKILNTKELSIDHKEHWRGQDNKLFWDLNNIAFSHKKCNYSNRRKKN